MSTRCIMINNLKHHLKIVNQKWCVSKYHVRRNKYLYISEIYILKLHITGNQPFLLDILLINFLKKWDCVFALGFKLSPQTSVDIFHFILWILQAPPFSQVYFHYPTPLFACITLGHPPPFENPISTHVKILVLIYVI